MMRLAGREKIGSNTLTDPSDVLRTDPAGAARVINDYAT